MKLSKIKHILNAEIITTDTEKLDSDITMCCGADLMSDVLAFIKRDALLLTGLTTPQVIYTADAADVKVVCFVRGKKPSIETVELAMEKKITLLSTEFPMYESCGRLYKYGLKGCACV